MYYTMYVHIEKLITTQQIVLFHSLAQYHKYAHIISTRAMTILIW